MDEQNQPYLNSSVTMPGTPPKRPSSRGASVFAIGGLVLAVTIWVTESAWSPLFALPGLFLITPVVVGISLVLGLQLVRRYPTISLMGCSLIAIAIFVPLSIGYYFFRNNVYPPPSVQLQTTVGDNSVGVAACRDVLRTDASQWDECVFRKVRTEADYTECRSQTLVNGSPNEDLLYNCVLAFEYAVRNPSICNLASAKWQSTCMMEAQQWGQ